MLLDNSKPPEASWESKLGLVKASIARNLTNQEFEYFLYLARRYQLDPLAKEIWAVKFKNAPAQIFVARDGLLRIAHESGMFAGIETVLIVERPDGHLEEVDVCPSNSTLMGAKCYVWRKDSDKPFTASVRFEDFNAKRNLWLTMPEVMVKKVAEAHCLRRAFSIHGLYLPEEFQVSQEVPPASFADTPQSIRDLPGHEQQKILEPLQAKLEELASLSEANEDELIQELTGERSLEDLTIPAARELYKELAERIRQIQQAA